MFIVGLICLPVYGLMSLFGLEHKPITGWLELAWLLFWLAVWQLAKRVH